MVIIQECMEHFQKYFANGSYHILFLVCLLLLLVSSVKISREISIYGFVLLFLIGNPITFFVVTRFFFEKAVYWRMYWMLPCVFVIAYAGVWIYQNGRGRGKRAFLLLAMTGVVVLSGTNILSPVNFTVSENPYKIPSEVINVCDVILEDAGEEARAIFPTEMLPYVRQYTAKINMPYGRAGATNSGRNAVRRYLWDEMNRNSPNTTKLIKYAKRGKYSYIVMSKEKRIEHKMQKRGYGLLKQTEFYNIYKAG